ncbi:MAG: ATP-binding protein [Peptococcaceae bacterium]|nr:ATP-binding protein [Peptococcaceae bacterium]
MLNKIYITVLFLAIASVVVATTFLASIFYSFFNQETSERLRSDALLLAELANRSDNDTGLLQSLSIILTENQVTLMDAAGEVLFDSKRRALPENSFLSPDIQDAIINGHGSDKYLSQNLDQEVYHHSIRLNNGNILRLSKTTHSIWGLYLLLLAPLILLLISFIVLCFYASKRLTDQITESINNINPDEDTNESFDELSPLLNRIDRQKKQTDRQIYLLEERLETIQAITEDMREGLLILDDKWTILSANISALRLLGDPAKEYAGQHLLQLTRNMTIINDIREALSGQPVNTVMTFEHRTMDVYTNPVFDQENISGVILLFLDITEKATAELIRREFSANVSHELKTPLTSILGYSELISSGMSKGADVAAFTSKINTEVKRLITLVNDIIKLSELDESSGKKELDSFDLLELVNQSADELALLAEEKEVSLEITGEQMEITANRSMIEELLINLLDNGIKNNQPGGRVTVSFRQEGEETIISVQDNGIGIAGEHLDRVFERFYQVDKSRSKKSGGTGLGLSIVKHIAQYHNGQATIESEVGKGTTVTAVLKT